MAFHPYPQLIPTFFNRNGFGPPLGITRASSWPWVDRIGFGSTATDSRRPWRLAFATAPRHSRLTSPVTSNSPDHNAKGTQSGDSRESSLLPLVGTRFQDLFHSPSGVLFTFPSRYWFTIGHGRVCSLGGWSPQIPTGFLVPRRTQVPEPHVCTTVSPTGLSPPVVELSSSLRLPRCSRAGQCPAQALQPRSACAPVWAPPVSLAATSGISFDFSSWS